MENSYCGTVDLFDFEGTKSMGNLRTTDLKNDRKRGRVTAGLQAAKRPLEQIGSRAALTPSQRDLAPADR